MQVSQQLNRAKSFSRASARQRLIAGLVFLVLAGFFAVLWLAGHYGITLWPFPCGFKQRYGLPCPGCGMTTSAVVFAQGKIVEAFYIQPAAALFCSVLAVVVFGAFVTAIFGISFDFAKCFFTEGNVKYVVLAVLIIFAAGWAVTLARALAAKGQG